MRFFNFSSGKKDCNKNDQFPCHRECISYSETCNFQRLCSSIFHALCFNVGEGECNLTYNSMLSTDIRTYSPFRDLQNCKKKNCDNGEFLCNHLKFCISIDLVCDGINHCFYNEDESFCSLFLSQTFNHQFNV